MRKIALAVTASTIALIALISGASSASAAGTPPEVPTPVQIAAGFTHTCALFDDGSVACWGTNTSGQLGDGSLSPTNKPVGVLGLTDIVEIDAGLSHTCALNSSGEVFCWGKNEAGQLGVGTVINSATPMKVPGVAGAVSIATGYFHTCAAVSNGAAVSCWGAGAFGALGNGTQDNSTSPTSVSAFGAVTKVFAGYQSTCSTLANDQVFCWGDVAYDKVSTVPKYTTTPRALADKAGDPVFATDIALGFTHGCAVGENYLCWGNDQYGQAGALAEPDKFKWDTAPVPVAGVFSPTSASAEAYTSCHVASTPTELLCMGLDTVTFVESEFVTQNPLADRPEATAGMRRWFFDTDITDVDSGFYHTCFITDGVVSCIGANHLGQSNGAANLPPASIEPLPVAFGPLMSFATNLDELTRAEGFVEDHATVLRLYRASFNREPDLGGASYWISIWNSGATLEEIAFQFAFSAEFKLRYGDQLTNEEFLAVVYQNVLGRDFDQEGFNYWLNLLETNQLTRAGAIQWISLGQEFVNANPYPAPLLSARTQK